MLVIAAVLITTLYRSYYRTVETTLSSYSGNYINAYFPLQDSETPEGFNRSARDFIENFTAADKMEAWVIDKAGRVIISSSGFEIEQTEMPDYNMALNSSDGEARWTGRTSLGEKMMAQTAMVSSQGGEYAGAVRLMV